MKSKMKNEQLRLFPDETSPQQLIYRKKKRKWENGFQNWSNDQGQHNETSPNGKCGYGSMCDYCKDNSYGRPCVRAFNAMVRDKWLNPDYDKLTYEDAWCGNFKKE